MVLDKRKSASQAKILGPQDESRLSPSGLSGKITGGRNRGAENGKFQEKNINQQSKAAGQS